MALLVGALIPLVAPVDRAAFDAVKDLGDGPDVLFALLDPHTRNYQAILLTALIVALLVQGPWRMVGAGAAIVVAGMVGYGLVEALGVLVPRPRPEEVLDHVALPAGMSWRLHPSYPSGHVVVTAALVAAAARCVPVLRWPLWAYAALIAWSRVAFGAHFPLDVLVAMPLGAAAGAVAVRFVSSVRLLLPPLPTTSRPSSAAG